MDSDSDSDSGGSHISATPPRDPPPPPPQARLPLLFSTKSRPKRKSAGAATDTSRPILKPKLSRKRPKSPQIHTPEASVQQCPLSIPRSSPVFSDLPFQISLTSQSSSSTPCNGANGTLPPPGLCASKLAYFSKFRKDNLNFEPIESDSDPIPRENCDSCDVVPLQVQNESSNSATGIKKRFNLIGSMSISSSSVPVKKVKGVNEGNFVKLNINGYGRKKLAFRGKRKNFGGSSSGRRRFYKSRGKKSKVGGESEGQEKRMYEGADVDMEIKQGKKVPGFDAGLLEEAIMKVRAEASEDNLVDLLKLTHGYDSFREGQLEAIKMVLSGKSTMLVLPTGAGKSLCYQLPSLVLPGVTIVVSPLVSLMIDQLKQLPHAIPGGFLSSSQTYEEASDTLRLLQDGAIKVLFVSPERFLNVEFASICSSSRLISLVVIDEAHCVSEWSHNFRPSYMRLRASLLRDKLHAECILAMTATATSKTLSDVMRALEIPKTNKIHAAKMRDNLQLSVSMSANRMKDLLPLLKSSPYTEAKSIIVYCKFQFEADLLSKYLSDNNIRAKSYHSAIPAKERSHIQEMFCSNKIRVVVATVAFGMGLDKRDVGAVIHYSLPESLEEYVQEIGRAGRDGTLSHCHLFVEDVTYFKIRSLIYSDGVDEYAVQKLLCHLFYNSNNSFGRIHTIIKESAARKFDIKEEVMLTILTQLELGEVQYLNLLPQINVTCTINFHQTDPAVLATKDFVVAAILKNSELKDGQYVFDIPSLANSLAMQVTDVSNHLHSLKWKGEITYELKDQAFCYTIVNAPSDICSLAAEVTKWLSKVEICKVRKIDEVFNAAVFAVKECDKLHGCHDYQHTSCLQRKILEYFNRDEDINLPSKIAVNSPFLRADIKVFLKSNSHAKFTPRAMARIMHGLGSPAFPSATWSKCHFWGRYMHIDFEEIMKAAEEELVSFVAHRERN